MTNAELIKALRYCGQEQDVIDCADCERRMIENGVDVDCEGRLLRDAADALEADERLLDLNTKRCEALRKQLRESHESYEKHLNELESQIPKDGEWIWEDSVCSPRTCSVCKQKFYIGRGWKYCPNCGAKMKTVTDCHTLEEKEKGEQE